MYTWKAQEPGFVGILDFTILLIAVLGAILISYPRYHIQFWLHKIWQSTGKSEYPDIRNAFYMGLANFADYVIIGALMLNLVMYVFQKLGLNIESIFI
jgi:hypothetical protein